MTPSFVSISEATGYAAALLVFATFYMRQMIHLRLVAIASKGAFIVYAYLQGLVPILVLHAALLPLNLLRLCQVMNATRKIRAAATGNLSLRPLLPFMTSRRAYAGEALFIRGEPSFELFYVVNGHIRLEDPDVAVNQGALLGEISLFSNARTRTATAICQTECELLSISHERVFALFAEKPDFAFYLVRLITQRLIDNTERLETELVRCRGDVERLKGELGWAQEREASLRGDPPSISLQDGGGQASPERRASSARD